jgi:hypothetical protein
MKAKLSLYKPQRNTEELNVQPQAPAALTREKHPLYSEWGWERCATALDVLDTPGFETLIVQPVAQALYSLSYPM